MDCRSLVLWRVVSDRVNEWERSIEKSQQPLIVGPQVRLQELGESDVVGIVCCRQAELLGNRQCSILRVARDPDRQWNAKELRVSANHKFFRSSEVLHAPAPSSSSFSACIAPSSAESVRTAPWFLSPTVKSPPISRETVGID